ncbi:MAG: PLP-dependent aminotransferase family protein [Anaerolineae bacterium]|nr:PLP-dependent aminotransferase family protein [Anaerolineae bacterium]
MPTLWSQRYAQRTQRMRSSAIRELLKLTEQPDMISFAGGLPAPEVFPIPDFATATARVLRDLGPQALQYGTTEGYRPLREMIARRAARDGLQVGLENVLITTGSQQALDLIGKVFVNPGDHLLVEAPTYLGALQAWNTYGAEYIPVPIDDDGMQTDALEDALRVGPKLIYALPTFQNPAGVTLSLPRRRRLVELAEEHGIPVVEDDPYGQLRFEGEDLPSLAALEGAGPNGHPTYHGNIIYLGTFSKILAPGLRLGWVIAPAEVIQKLVQAKQGSDLHTPTFTQVIAHTVADDQFLDRHVRFIRQVYRERRDVMLEALAEHFPTGVRWTHPRGGLFLWVTLPLGARAVDILPRAIERKVAFVPGDSFFPCGGGENTMRLNFSNAAPDMIREGIARLGRVLDETLQPTREATFGLAEALL